MRATTLLLVLLAVSPLAAADAVPKGWIQMFDGKTLNGWKASERPEAWTVENRTIVSRGERSHLFYMTHECENCEFKAEVKLNKGGNSGMFFRTRFETGWPTGYEAQVNNSHGDWRRTASLYRLFDIKEQLVPDDTWWTQHIIVNGNHTIIKVNGKTVVDYLDHQNTYQKGYLAIQQHHDGSVVEYRNLMMKVLPVKKK